MMTYGNSAALLVIGAWSLVMLPFSVRVWVWKDGSQVQVVAGVIFVRRNWLPARLKR